MTNKTSRSDILTKITRCQHPYVIAEIGINHNGDRVLAKEMISAAAESGADCVKFQSLIADEYISPIAPRAGYQDRSSTGKKTQLELIRECEITIEDAAELRDYSESKKVDFLSTPFEVRSLQGLVSIGVGAIKISSCNLTNYPFLEAVSKTGLPVLLSTGMGNMVEVEKAVNIFEEKNSKLMLFQCTSNYPAKLENANIRVIETYEKAFRVPVGYSDHTEGNIAAIVAVSLGALAVEKHFTLSRKLPGIDQNASIEPSELKELVCDLRNCRLALGSRNKMRADEEEDTAAALRRSLVASREIAAGEVLTSDMVVFMRPGTGLSTDHLFSLLGRKFVVGVKTHHLISREQFAENAGCS